MSDDFHFVVTEQFGGYLVGQHITDPAQIAALSAEDRVHVRRIATSPVPVPDAPKGA